MIYDKTETLRSSFIQHGPANQRVYLMKLALEDLPDILDDLQAMGRANSYTKIFAKIPGAAEGAFLERGYIREALIPGFYGGQEDGVFVSTYLDPGRGRDEHDAVVKKNLVLAEGRAGSPPEALPPSPYEIRVATPADVQEMAAIYREVFPTYPFPITEADYLAETMASHVVYFAAVKDGVIGALSSAEMDRGSQNVEMTDFATLPDHLGQGLAVRLLWYMEREMPGYQMRTAYTIARSMSPGMNITFAKMGYLFAGTLVNNTDISGQIESMNIWYKPLADGAE